MIFPNSNRACRQKRRPKKLSVVANSIAYFGKYSLDETSMVLSLDIHASTFANLAGSPSEKRNITSLTDSELKFNRPFVRDVTLEAVFERAE